MGCFLNLQTLSYTSLILIIIGWADSGSAEHKLESAKNKRGQRKCKNNKEVHMMILQKFTYTKNVVQNLGCPENPELVDEGYHQKIYTHKDIAPPGQSYTCRNESYDMNSCRIT